MKRLAALLSWVVPPVFLVALYWHGLHTWFQLDDFAWLDITRRIYDFPTFLREIFVPAEHGTFRPFSERGFFFVFRSLFGVDALPFHIWMFLTQMANLTLLNWNVRRLTGSAAAGLLAALFWTAHPLLVTAVAWTSAYMQVLCGFCLLLAFHFWLRHVETGRRRYWAALWVVFLLGFGVMETNLVLPALIGAHAWFFARRYFARALWLLAPSAAFVAFHMTLAPKQAAGPYSIHIDLSVARTLWTYWNWALGAGAIRTPGLPPGTVTGAVLLLSALLLGFAAWSAWRRRWLPLLFLLWFLILLAPVLPLRDHVSDYYLTLPLMGLATLGAWGFVTAFRQKGRARFLWGPPAALAALVFLVPSIPAAGTSARAWRERGEEVRAMVLGVARARQLHPQKTILLDGVNNELFWGGVCDGGFRAVGVFDVYLAPGSAARIEDARDLCGVREFVLPYQAALRARESGNLVVYRAGGSRLRNITSTYRPVKDPGSGFRLDLGSRAADAFLGKGWYESSRGGRWMSGSGSGWLPGPPAQEGKLILTGYCPQVAVEGGPQTVAVTIDGRTLPPGQLLQAGPYRLEFSLPAESLQKDRIEFQIQVDRTFKVAHEPRELGLAFGALDLR
ncbi:MAG: hypothetical protein IT158_20600 [Bryobacterales bacterium]|nr:hypothetical protein [Bryobacterales bacterium]